VEWEDLLVRLEIVPRALRLAVEDVGDSRAARDIITRAVGSEWWVHQVLLPALRSGTPAPGNPSASLDIERNENEPDAAALAATFTSLRDRNFAQIQRRGLGVWDWRSEVEGGSGSFTAYQLMQWMARTDGELLAALRASGGGR
jgi:hypothetical protein